jgi:K+-transporting ATPase KdpF subunit
MYERYFLYRGGGRFLRRLLVPDQGLREIVIMDYLLAGIAAFFLFLYLVYALLKPERF